MNYLSNNTIAINNHISLDKSENTLELSIDNNIMAETEVHSPFKDSLCPTDDKRNINQIWSKETFTTHENGVLKKNYLKASLSLDLKPIKTTWASKRIDENFANICDEDEVGKLSPKFQEKDANYSPTDVLSPDKESSSPSHHARRPMNAFLIFCKKHRPIVRQRFPHLENRGVTRILGEWWALLDTNEKSSYTNLAKEYKDAFFSANPDFKWYKLPAPPLRTLNTRPVNIPQKSSSPLTSPTGGLLNSTEFTPGKLADETQLGNLTSLMNANDNVIKSQENNSVFINNNNIVQVITKENMFEQEQLTPIADNIKITSEVPKPIKKRKFEEHSLYESDNNKNVVRNLFNDSINDTVKLNESVGSYIENNNEYVNNEEENMTQQDLLNKVVDSMFIDEEVDADLITQGIRSNQKSKETRKSGRSCKGKRYAEFMIEGKLLGNKQMRKIAQFQGDIANKFEDVLNTKIENMHNKNETQTPKLDLGDMIKRLAERTNVKLEDLGEEVEEPEENGDERRQIDFRQRTESENSEDALAKSQNNFNLDLRIAELPCLSYEMFLQRKKDSKKRKSVRSKSESSVTKTKVMKLSSGDSNYLVGSQKRKNKNSITRLEVPNETNAFPTNFNNDLFALATLAEVAANTEKIHEV